MLRSIAHKIVRCCGVLLFPFRRKQLGIPDLMQNLLAMVTNESSQRNYDLLQNQFNICQALLARLSNHPNRLLFASIQDVTGLTLTRLAELDGDVSLLYSAIEYFDAALSIMQKDQMPMEWAGTQANKGSALGRLGDLIGDLSALRRAQTALKSAIDCMLLEEVSAAPWLPSLKNNTSIVLLSLGRMMGDIAVLYEANDMALSAVDDLSKDKLSIQYVMSVSNLATILTTTLEFYDSMPPVRRFELLRQATDVWEELDALIESNSGRMDLSLVCIVLGNLCLRHGDLMDSVRTLRRADDAYLRALRAIDGNQARYYRALCQHNRGVVLRKLFTLTKNEKFLQDGEEAYRFALQECSRDLTPLDWAMTQLGLANIIHDIWKITGDSQRIKEAEDAYWGALEIAETSSADELRQHIARALISLLVSRSRFRDAISVITPTLARSDAVMIDAFRSRDGAARAVELVSDLYGMSSECLLRQEEPDSVGALIVAEAGRARFFANSSAISAVQPKLLSDSGLRDLMERAFERRASLRVRLGYDESIKHTERAALSATERRLLQDKLLKATDDYVSLCREHGLIVTPEPLTLADIQAAVPDGGALVLPVLTEQAAFVFILTDSGAPEVVAARQTG